MATVYKILGQKASSANTEYILYTVPTTYAVASSITVCNRGSTATTFRIALNVTGATTTTKDYLYYEVPIGPYDTFIATVGLTLSQGDTVKVYSTSNNLSFQLFGSEIS